MKRLLIILLSILPSFVLPAQVYNRAPLEASCYAELPLGSVRAEGWLLEQLRRQADGLTGHLDEVYPQVMGKDNAWLGGDGDAWERGPYWIDGLLPLAWILDDAALKEKASQWVEAILASSQENGYFGPSEDHPFVYGLQRGKAHDWWPKMVALKILTQYYDATCDARVLDCLTRYFRYQMATLPDKPLNHWSDWGAWRGADNIEAVWWLYNRTGEPWLLQLGELLHSQTKDWTGMFTKGDIFTRQNSVHCVNLGQGFKAPVVWWQYSHEASDLEASWKAAAVMRHTVGLPTGLWAGDEALHYGDPVRGSELCTAVEMMYSLEGMLRATGDIRYADWLERVAFNALPAQVSDDYRSKQYFQQTNQVSCIRDWREFSTPHDGTDVLFGTLNGYPCCLSNMHQGWPKFTRNLWYATPDGGLAALVYAPSCVRTMVAGGVEAVVRETTDYPFRETVSFTIDYTRRKVRKASFPMRFRVPEWCQEPVVTVNGETVESNLSDGIIVLSREWKRGDCVELCFPMQLRTEEWYDKALTVVRGPLVYALKMDEEWTWKPFEGSDRYFGEGAWEVRSSSPWNYCIMRDSFKVDACKVVEKPADGYTWNVKDAPVSVFIPVRTLPHWKEVSAVAYHSTDGYDVGDEAVVELIPYGCTTLRIACFPSRIIPWDRKFREEY